MPDADGRIRPVSVPDVPWCRRCKLVECVCPPTKHALCRDCHEREDCRPGCLDRLCS